MARLIWTSAASRHFDEICTHLVTVAPDYAGVFARGVTALAEDITEQPYFGAEVEKYEREDVRERLFDSYRVIYRVNGDEVEMLAVIHAARQLPRKLPW